MLIARAMLMVARGQTQMSDIDSVNDASAISTLLRRQRANVFRSSYNEGVMTIKSW